LQPSRIRQTPGRPERLVLARPGTSVGSWLRWAALAACFWTAVALVFVVPQLGHGGNWHALLLASLAQWWSWGLLAPIITAIDRRLTGGNRGRIVVHLVVAPVVALVYAYVAACVAAAIGAGKWSQVLSAGILSGAWRELFWSLLIYGLIVGVWEAFHYQQRMERLERNFAEARLNGLRMQLDPHFLFNALNTISAHVEREPRLVRKMIEHLGDLLRHSLSSHSRSMVTLAEELACLDHYLAIQKIRFGPHLRVNIDLAQDVSQALVPSMFLQPLVENAIRHGLAPRATGGAVIISAARRPDGLHVRVIDDGVGLPARWSLEERMGVGLSVTRERIAGLYPQGSTHFSVQPCTEGGTAVDIRFPWRDR
jgi:two-component system, LytTR family, sensor kinase